VEVVTEEEDVVVVAGTVSMVGVVVGTGLET
jgi:hypothetical protein